MSINPRVIYSYEMGKIKEVWSSLVWDLMLIEQSLKDSQDDTACKTMIKISKDLETVSVMVKKKPEILNIDEVATDVKAINDFAQKLQVIIRGRSWHATCRAFDSVKSLDNIKSLERSLKVPVKNRRKRTVQVKSDDSRLVDDEMMFKYHGKIQDKRREPIDQEFKPKYTSEEEAHRERIEAEMFSSEMKERLAAIKKRSELRKPKIDKLTRGIPMKALDFRNLWR